MVLGATDGSGLAVWSVMVYMLFMEVGMFVEFYVVISGEAAYIILTNVPRMAHLFQFQRTK